MNKMEKKKMNQEQKQQIKNMIETIQKWNCAGVNCCDCPFTTLIGSIGGCGYNKTIATLKNSLLETCPICGQAIPTN